MSDHSTLQRLPDMHPAADHAMTAKTGILGIISTFGTVIVSFSGIEAGVRLASLTVGLIVGLITLWRLLFPKPPKPPKKKRENPNGNGVLVLFVAGCLILGAGCTSILKAKTQVQGKLDSTKAGIAEETRALNTGVVDSLSVAPTNKPTALALQFAQRNQQLLGVPQTRIDVAAVLADQQEARRALQERFELQGRLMAEKSDLEAKLKDAEAKLIDMGAKYEAERNKSIFRRILTGLLGTIGIGGIIALFVFCPAAIPLLTHFAAFVVAKIPALAGLLGVVSTKAWDSVVSGIEKAKKEISIGDRDKLLTSLSKDLDRDHKALVRARKPKPVQS